MKYTTDHIDLYFTGDVEDILPEEYQEVEYLSSNADEPYIDINLTGDQKTKAQVTFASTETVATCLFGYQANAIGITFNLSDRSNSTRFGSWAKVGWGSDMFDGQKHTVEISQQGLYQDETLVEVPTTQTFTTGNFYLFKANGAATYGGKTIYDCKIWNDDILQCNLVPCYRKADNVAGMYDLVTKAFFTNAGTGSFTVGPDVTRAKYKRFEATEADYNAYTDVTDTITLNGKTYYAVQVIGSEIPPVIHTICSNSTICGNDTLVRE